MAKETATPRPGSTASTRAGGLHVQERKSKSEFRKLVSRFARNRLAVFGLVIIFLFVLVALFAPILAPYDPIRQSLPDQLQGSSSQYWLGTDEFGRDILSRIIVGSRISLMVGVIATAIGATVGVCSGLIAGYSNKLDNLIMRLMDILLAFPSIILAIAIIAVLGPSLFNVMIAVGVNAIPLYARLARSTTLSLKEKEFVEASRAIGCEESRILFRHIFPNTLSPLIVFSTLQIGTAILSASILSFLGLGIQPPEPEWGQMVNQGRGYLRDAPHIATYPGIAIFLVVMGFNLLGDGLRDVLDPRLRN
jgi:peptide/nickel transport system permease protein